MNIRAIIVEDSRLARNELRELIKNHSQITIVGDAENVDEAYQLIQETNPDLLFLDINMPEKDGFELLEMLDEVCPSPFSRRLLTNMRLNPLSTTPWIIY